MAPDTSANSTARPCLPNRQQEPAMNKLGIAAMAALAFTMQPVFGAGFMTAQEFVTRASASGHAEVELAKLALQKSSAPDIRAFAQKMVDDHDRTNQELTALARPRSLAVAGPDETQRAAIAELRKKSGPAFDAAYAQQAQKDHDEAVSLFSAAGTLEDDDKALAEFARKTLPRLTEHQQAAAQLGKVR
jgi:putative membrane protein